MTSISPIKRSAASCGWNTTRPGKMSRLNLTGRGLNLQRNNNNNNNNKNNNNTTYGTTLQQSTGSRMQFRPTQSPVTITPVPSPTNSDRSSRTFTPPREPRETTISTSSQLYQMTMQPFHQQKSPSSSSTSSFLFATNATPNHPPPSNIGGKGFFSSTTFGSMPITNTIVSHSSATATATATVPATSSSSSSSSPHAFQRTEFTNGMPASTSFSSSSSTTLNFSPALRPSSPPSLSLPTLEQLGSVMNEEEDTTMGDDNTMDQQPEHDNNLNNVYHTGVYNGGISSLSHPHRFQATPSPLESMNNMSNMSNMNNMNSMNNMSSMNSGWNAPSNRPSSRSSSISSYSQVNNNPLLHQMLGNNRPNMIRSQSFESAINPSRPGTPLKAGNKILWNFRQASPTSRTNSRASNTSILSNGPDNYNYVNNSNGGTTNNNNGNTHIEFSPVIAASSFPASFVTVSSFFYLFRFRPNTFLKTKYSSFLHFSLIFYLLRYFNTVG